MTGQRTSSSPPPGFVTEAEAAEMLGKKPSTLRRWARGGDGPARVMVGRTYLYRLDAITRWLTGKEASPGVRQGATTSTRN